VAERGAWRHRSPARNVGPPVVLFAALSLAVYTLAKLQLAEPAAPAAPGAPIVLGDSLAGAAVFDQNCASCHGAGGVGGGIGPRLAGSEIDLVLAQDRIQNGKGVMPPKLVTGRAEANVLAYVKTLLEAG